MTSFMPSVSLGAEIAILPQEKGITVPAWLAKQAGMPQNMLSAGTGPQSVPLEWDAHARKILPWGSFLLPAR